VIILWNVNWKELNVGWKFVCGWEWIALPISTFWNWWWLCMIDANKGHGRKYSYYWHNFEKKKRGFFLIVFFLSFFHLFHFLIFVALLPFWGVRVKYPTDLTNRNGHMWLRSINEVRRPDWGNVMGSVYGKKNNNNNS